METAITPNHVQSLTDFTDEFLCEIKDNIYDLKFIHFKVRDMDSGFVMFEVSDDDGKEEEESNGNVNGGVSKSVDGNVNGNVNEVVAEDINIGTPHVTLNGSANNEETAESSNNVRTIRYHLGPDFLELRNIGTALTFSVGSLPIKNLLMIERHYFKGRLIKSFEFKFDFCIPNSTNSWETIYEIPELEADLKEEMIDCPWETKSDSFYFVGNQLIMHHKALYNYSPILD